MLLLTAEILTTVHPETLAETRDHTRVHPADLGHTGVAEAQARQDLKVKCICASRTTIELAHLPITAGPKLAQTHQDRRSLTKATNPLAQESLQIKGL